MKPGGKSPSVDAGVSRPAGTKSASFGYGSVKPSGDSASPKPESPKGAGGGSTLPETGDVSPSAGSLDKTTVTDSTSSGADSKGAFSKQKNAPFEVGDRVENERFGCGEVREVIDMGRDWMITVDFDEMGIKKMFAGFINLKKL